MPSDPLCPHLKLKFELAFHLSVQGSLHYLHHLRVGHNCLNLRRRTVPSLQLQPRKVVLFHSYFLSHLDLRIILLHLHKTQLLSSLGALLTSPLSYSN